MTDDKRKQIGDLADADADVRRRAMSGLGIGDESDLPAFLIDCLSSTDREVGWAAKCGASARLGIRTRSPFLRRR